MNENGAQCLPYPEKRSTIGEIVAWFDKEIQALPDTIAKANKNFLFYCLIGVLLMLQGHAKCRHIDGLAAIMNSCDASILNEVPNDIAKLSALYSYCKMMVVFIWPVICYRGIFVSSQR